MKRFLLLSLLTTILCGTTLTMYARTDCSGYKPTYPDHYCACYYDHTKLSKLEGINDLHFNDSIWFRTSLKTFLNDGLTLYLFSESDVQIEIYDRCTAMSARRYSLTVHKNQTRDVDQETLLAKLKENGVAELNIGVYVVFYPLTEGADCRLMCYPYNHGPQSTADNPLPVLIDMTYVSAHEYDVYELKADAIPSTLALYTQWKEANNMACHLKVTRGSADGEVVAEHDFLDSESHFYFDPMLLASVQASGESLYMHYTHDASAAGRIVTKDAKASEVIEDVVVCQGKGLQLADTLLTEPTVYLYSAEWISNTKVQLNKYNLTFSAPEAQPDTIYVKSTDLPMYYRGQGYIPAGGYGDYDFTVVQEGECDERYLLHVVHQTSTEYATIDTTLCQGRSFVYKDQIYTTNTAFVDSTWLNEDVHQITSISVHFTAPEMEYDTVYATAAELAQGYYYAPADTYIYTAGAHVYEVVVPDECTRLITVEMVELPTSGLETPSLNEPSARMIIRNGVVLIQRADKIFTVLGEPVE